MASTVSYDTDQIINEMYGGDSSSRSSSRASTILPDYTSRPGSSQGLTTGERIAILNAASPPPAYPLPSYDDVPPQSRQTSPEPPPFYYEGMDRRDVTNPTYVDLDAGEVRPQDLPSAVNELLAGRGGAQELRMIQDVTRRAIQGGGGVFDQVVDIGGDTRTPTPVPPEDQDFEEEMRRLMAEDIMRRESPNGQELMLSNNPQAVQDINRRVAGTFSVDDYLFRPPTPPPGYAGLGDDLVQQLNSRSRGEAAGTYVTPPTYFDPQGNVIFALETPNPWNNMNFMGTLIYHLQTEANPLNAFAIAIPSASQEQLQELTTAFQNIGADADDWTDNDQDQMAAAVFRIMGPAPHAPRISTQDGVVPNLAVRRFRITNQQRTIVGLLEQIALAYRMYASTQPSGGALYTQAMQNATRYDQEARATQAQWELGARPLYAASYINKLEEVLALIQEHRAPLAEALLDDQETVDPSLYTDEQADQLVADIIQTNQDIAEQPTDFNLHAADLNRVRDDAFPRNLRPL